MVELRRSAPGRRKHVCNGPRGFKVRKEQILITGAKLEGTEAGGDREEGGKV